MADIFLSYAREDSGQAKRLALALESRGWSVWWDRHIPHGQDFTAHIQQQLDDARCIVVLWSKAAVKSSFVRDEAAEGLNGRLVPLLIENVKQPLGFRQLHAADLCDWNGQTTHDEFARLTDSIAALVAPRVPIAASPSTSWAPVSRPLTDVDVWIGFSPLDDVELVEGRRGWVSNFSRALQVRLSQLLGRSAVVVMETAPRGDESWAEHELASIRRAACFVAVVSPRYSKSDWASRALTEFVRSADAQGGVALGHRSRLFKLLKTPVPPENTPALLQGLLGYEFFKVDPESGRVRELDEVFGPEAHRQFLLKLDDLAHDIVSTVEHYRQTTAPPQA